MSLGKPADRSVDCGNLSALSSLSSEPRLHMELQMAKKAPWHSVKAEVYHDDTNWNTGNNIESENIRSGTGGKPKCAECKRLDK